MHTHETVHRWSIIFAGLIATFVFLYQFLKTETNTVTQLPLLESKALSAEVDVSVGSAFELDFHSHVRPFKDQYSGFVIEIPFVNSSDKNYSLKLIDKSCSCIVSQNSEFNLEPNEKQLFTLTFEPSTGYQDFQHLIKFKVSASGEEEEDLIVVLVGEILNQLNIGPTVQLSTDSNSDKVKLPKFNLLQIQPEFQMWKVENSRGGLIAESTVNLISNCRDGTSTGELNVSLKTKSGESLAQFARGESLKTNLDVSDGVVHRIVPLVVHFDENLLKLDRTKLFLNNSKSRKISLISDKRNRITKVDFDSELMTVTISDTGQFLEIRKVVSDKVMIGLTMNAITVHTDDFDHQPLSIGVYGRW